MDDMNIGGLKNIIERAQSNRTDASEGYHSRSTLHDYQVLALFRRIEEADAIITAFMFGEAEISHLTDKYESAYKTGMILNYHADPLKKSQSGFHSKKRGSKKI